MKAQLARLLRQRIQGELAPQNPVSKVVREVSFERMLDIAISIVYLYTRVKRGANKTVYFTEIVSAIGHAVMSTNKMKTSSSLAVKVGAFLLYSFEELDLIETILGQGGKTHNAYIVNLVDDDKLTELWNQVEEDNLEKLPSTQAYSPWETTRHASGHPMIKTGNARVNKLVKKETHPILFSCLNKAQEIGWTVNAEVLEIQKWALRNKSPAFNDIWSQRSIEARRTKMREAKAIANIAERFLDKTFYHLYYYDFRGRRYPTTAYLHEQGSDVARGLLRMEDRRRLGEAGLRWLFVMIANTWGGDSGREDGLKTDKIPVADRRLWAEDNLEIFLSYAESPKVNQGWMEADKPWQFLACCMELKYAFLCDNPEDYCSGLPGFMDGSNNGSQHLAALVRDEVTAPHVNLVPLELPGDLYLYVANNVWQELERIVETYDPSTLKECNRYIDNLIEIKKKLMSAEANSDLRKEVVLELEHFRDDHLSELASPVYWSRIKSDKERRKIVKRNVMTLPYGGTAYGLGKQQIDDAKKHGIELLHYLEHRWGSYMGRLVYQNCRHSLAKPMQLLTVFENAGKAAEERGEFLSWTVPLTNFPVVQNYTQGTMHKVYVQYGPPKGPRLSTKYYVNTLQLHVSFVEDTQPMKHKQSQGASPNGIHSLDGAHLALTVDAAEFPMVTIHDSYGCHLANMDLLYVLVRDKFVELYETDPLALLAVEMQADISEIEYGTLDLNLIRQSEYCFI